MAKTSTTKKSNTKKTTAKKKPIKVAALRARKPTKGKKGTF